MLRAFMGGLAATVAVAVASPSFAAMTILHAFGNSDGQSPEGLTIAADGSIYGTTLSGGADPTCDTGGYTGCGTIFRFTAKGGFKSAASFAVSNGGFPTVSVSEASNGAIYGVTDHGGASSGCVRGCGTVYRLLGGSTIKTIASFDGTTASMPSSPLLPIGNDGFYGATYAGGDANCRIGGCGTIFHLPLVGQPKILARFGFANGAGPYGALARDAGGNLYGSTYFGGLPKSRCSSSGCGVIFRMAPGQAPVALHSFIGSDGTNPLGLTAGPDGNFYGMTQYGGRGNNGTVFRITPDGLFTTIGQFNGNNGSVPAGKVAIASDGTLYGTTYYGGPTLYGGGSGVLFRVAQSGVLTPLEYFNYHNGGGLRDLALGPDGMLYGVAQSGGPNSGGVLFKFDPNSTDPDAFDFGSRSNATRNQLYISPGVALSGLGKAAPISINGGQFRTRAPDSGSVWSPWTGGPGIVEPGTFVQVAVRAIPQTGQTATATLTVGTVSGSYKVITQ